MAIALSGSLLLTGSLTTTGTITAQTLNVQQVTSSIVYSSGSNIFGNSLSNTQTITGSVSVTGSLSVNGISTVGSVIGTTNYVPKFTGTNALGNSQIFDNGTNVGIATTSLVADALLPIQINAGTSGQAYFASNNNGSYGLLMGYDNANGYARIRNISNTALTFETNNSEKMRLDSSGNLGLGVTPSAGWVQGKALEVGFAGISIWGRYVNEVHMTMNYYYSTSANARVYSSNNPASDYEQFNGNHTWYSAPSGTAGNAITFTQAMTLTASGRLLINKTDESTYQLDVNGTGRFAGDVLVYTTSTSISNILQFVPTNISGQIRGQFVLQASTASNVNANDAYIWKVAAVGGAGNAGNWNSNLNFLRTTRNGVTDEAILSLNGYTGAATFSSTLSLKGGLTIQRASSGAESDINFLNEAGAGPKARIRFGGTIEELSFWTGTTTLGERMRITEGGNVGIGTTTPKSYAGYTVLTLGNSSNNGGILSFRSTYNSGDGAEIYQSTSGDIYFNTNSATISAILKVNGNLLIGTTTDAGGKLQVNAASSSSILRIAGGGDGTGGGKGNIRSSDQGGTNYFDFGRDNLTTGNFVLTSGGGSPLLSITTSGAATFSSTVTATQFYWGGTTNNNLSAGSISIVDAGTGTKYLQFSVSNTVANIATNYSNANIPLTLNSYGNTNQLYLSTGGNVGIGTDTPGGLLDVRTVVNSGATGVVFVTGANGVGGGARGLGFMVRATTNDTGGVISDLAFFGGGKENGTQGNDASYSFIQTRANGGTMTDRLTIASTGAATFSSSVTANTFIKTGSGEWGTFNTQAGGASSSSYYQNYGTDSGSNVIRWYVGQNAFRTDGSFAIQNTAGTGLYLTTGNTSWTSTSDERSKDIIRPITNALKDINSWRTLIGKYKNDEIGKERMFLIAQDILLTTPQVVDMSDEGNLGLRYLELIPVLVKAIQELNEKIIQLENK